VVGRFATEDSARASLNWYTYCNNSPVLFIDPLGLKEVAARAYSESKGATVHWTGNVTINGVIYANARITLNGISLNIKGELKNGRLMIDDSILNSKFGWSTSSGSASLFSVNTTSNNLSLTGPTASGQFKDGIFFGSGSSSLGYGELNGRLQVNSDKSGTKGLLGAYGKASVGNVQGKVGVGDDNLSVSLKGVGDVLTATGQAGIQYKDGFGIVASAMASAASGRATIEFGVFDWQVEVGVSGYAGGIGGAAKVGYFPEDGFVAKVDAIVGVGGGFIIRVKP
jgi:hypothetical protein